MLAEIDVGHLVAGKYELVRLIGKGAMGEVWLATHNSLGGEFAIKLVKRSDDEDASAAARFQLEAQISAKLSRRTRHIVSVSDHGEEDGLAYLVMERLDGESLEERIQRTGELSLAETVGIAMQIARALGHAHAEGIFHRDLKPANLFLTKDEDGRLLVKLLDFGIARSAKPFGARSAFATGKDMVLGTPSYMSPEQARGLDTLDHRCDLWALAVVAYESLTREIPWEGESIEDIFLSICTHRGIPLLERRPDLPRTIETVFVRAFAPKLDERFRTAAELSAALEALVDPLAVEAAMMGGAPPSATSSARRLPSARDPFPDGAAASGRLDAHRGDPSGIAVVGAPVTRRSRASVGWVLAAVAALVTLGAILLGFRSFASRGPAARTAAGDPTSPTPPSSAVPPPSTTVPPAAAAATTAATNASTRPPRGPVRASPSRQPTPPVTGSPRPGIPAGAVAAPAVAPAPPPPATTRPAAAPAPSVPDTSGVF